MPPSEPVASATPHSASPVAQLPDSQNRSVPAGSAVCVAGMHRSGTSMVTRLLNLCGLHLGEPEQIIGPQADNPRGFWENRQFVLLNDAILAYLGGGWDRPPTLSTSDPAWQQVLTIFGDEARALIASMPTTTAWGWKDPRTSLTLPFWSQLLPDLRLVICVRNPREVASSLQRRNGTSLAFGHDLWLQYNSNLQEETAIRSRIVTHYESYFYDPVAELTRLVTWLAWPDCQEDVVRACATIDGSLRHCRSRSLHALCGPQANALRKTYAEICQEAGPVQATVHTAAKRLTTLVMLTHNALSCTRQCVDSVLAHTQSPYELICVDNASSDGTLTYLEDLAACHQQIRLLSNTENLGFAAGSNRGMSAARGDHIVLINNDLVVTNGWLERLQECADRADNIGLVGPVTNNISGPQKLSCVAYDTESLEGLDAFATSHALRNAGIARSYWRIAGFCMLIKREVIEAIGGLDERYGLGNFEDDDFCLRTLLAGFEAWLALDCFVHHHGSQSFIAAGVDYQSCLLEKWEIFKEKWGIPATVPYGADFDLAPQLDALRGSDLIYYPLPGQEKVTAVATANALWRRGQREDAVTRLAQDLKNCPDNREAVWQLGHYLYDLGHTNQAIRLFTGYLNRHRDEYPMRESLRVWQEDQASPSASRVSPSVS